MKENLTCGAHTSVSGGREAAGGVLVHTEDVYTYRPDSGPRHPEDIENSKHQVEEEL